MMFVSLGAIASMPDDEISLSSKIGRHDTPLLVDLKTPPAAVAMYTVFDGLGMPCTSDSRPMKFDGPTLRHLKAAMTLESSVCAGSGAPKTTAAVTAARKRDRCMTNPSGGGMKRS